MPSRSKGHRAISHDVLSSVAYDWERVGDPSVEPRWPFKIYLPRSTEDVVRAVHEARAHGQRLTVRGSGHSSNGLVTDPGGAILLTERLDQVLDVDAGALTCTMQAGVPLAEVDKALGDHGLGLAVVGDHGDLTAGGFASVGGISPASLRHGLFVDTVRTLEYVDWEGDVHRCGRADDRDRFLRVLTGLGRYGVITTLTVDLVRVDKRRTVLRNDRFVTSRLDDFLTRSGELVRDPGGALFARGLWVDVPLGERSAGLGQYSSYHATAQRPHKALRSRLNSGYRRLLGSASTRLPPALGTVVKYLGVASMLMPASYTTVGDIERFSDDTLDSGVGDPTRMLIVLAPAERYETVARELLDVCTVLRRDSAALTAIALYVKPIRSPYLSGGAAGRRHCELTLMLGIDPDRMTADLVAKLVDRVDDVAIEHGALRYLHTRTSDDPERRRLLDPNRVPGAGETTSDGGEVDGRSQ